MEEVDLVNLMAVSAAIAMATGIPALFPRMPEPGVVFEILFGVIIGPQVRHFYSVADGLG